MGIQLFLHSSCCFLNTKTAIMVQLIRTARTLEADWWQVCREACVQGQRKMSQVPGVFGLLDFNMLRPFLVWRAFWNLWTAYLFNLYDRLFVPWGVEIKGLRMFLGSWFYLLYLVYQASLNFIIYFYFPILKELITYVSCCFININNMLLVMKCYSSFVVSGFSRNESNSTSYLISIIIPFIFIWC